jgi:hypothetical protein
VRVDAAATPQLSPTLRRAWSPWSSVCVVVFLVAALALSAPAASAAVRSADEADFNAAFATSVDDAERQAQLVQGEDERLIDVRVAGAARQVTYPLRPYRVRSSGFYTLVLPARRAVYTLTDLRELAPQTFLRQRDGSYLLREHILVDTGATLTLAPSKPTTIRMSSGAAGFVSIVTRGGRLRLLGSAAAPLSFTSWDETATKPDKAVNDGRAYILAMGQLVVKHANFQDLGFWSGRTGGLALAGSGAPSAGLDLGSEETKTKSGSSTDSREAEILPSGALPAGDESIETIVGEVSDTKITGNTFGLFVTGASGTEIRNVTIANSLIHGLVLHRSVRSAQVEQVRVEKSGADGVVVTRGVEAALLTQVTSTGNGRDGVVITGTPLAKGPSPSGSSIRQFGNNVLTASLIENNARTAVRIVGGTQVRLLGNSIKGGVQGVLVSAGAADIVIDANRVTDVNGSGIQIRDANGIEVSGNSVRRTNTGVHVMNAQAEVQDNTVASATLHAISLIGDTSGTTITSNALGGRGSSAIDMARLEGGTEPELKANDLSGWNRVITQDGVISILRHPLTVVWILVALLLITGQIRVYRRRHIKAVPYADGPAKSQSIAAIEADQAHALRQMVDATVTPPRTPQRPQLQLETAPQGLDLREVRVGRVEEYAGQRVTRPDNPSRLRPSPASSQGLFQPNHLPTAEDKAAWIRQGGKP